MEHIPAVSIIVPVYDSVKQLPRCINSILSQSFADFELLLIDDGSKDGSSELCDEFAKRDSRIKVFHKKNGGVSSARNLGLDNSSGQYLTFVDSDDEMLPGFLELAMRHPYDVVSGGIQYVGGEGSRDEIKAPAEYHDNEDIMKVAYEGTPRFRGPYAMVWRREAIADTRFDETMRLAEDSVFSLLCLSKCKSMYVLEENVYVYYIPLLQKKYSLSISELENHMERLVAAYDSCEHKSVSFLSERMSMLFSCAQREITLHPFSFGKHQDLIGHYHRFSNLFSVNTQCYYDRILEYPIASWVWNTFRHVLVHDVVYWIRLNIINKVRR